MVKRISYMKKLVATLSRELCTIQRGGETVCRTKKYWMRKSRKDVQQEKSWGTRGREKRVFVVAPKELLKMYMVVVLIFFIEHIISQGF